MLMAESEATYIKDIVKPMHLGALILKRLRYERSHSGSHGIVVKLFGFRI